MFLSLLNPSGRMVVIIDEEALLVSRAGSDPHDYSREVMCHVSGDFGELEDPTPWEVQEAIQRIKERERKKGQEQARAELASLRCGGPWRCRSLWGSEGLGGRSRRARSWRRLGVGGLGGVGGSDGIWAFTLTPHADTRPSPPPACPHLHPHPPLYL